MKSVMMHDFSKAPQANIERSQINLSHGWKGTFDSDVLIPFFCMEVLPGDTIRVKSTVFARLATPIVPILDNIYCDTFYFFVPNRLTWIHWEEFCGANKTTAGIQPTTYLMPKIKNTTGVPWGIHSLPDYFGINPQVEYVKNGGVNALPFRSYTKIWNDWFRSQDIQGAEVEETGDGPNTITSMPLLYRCKKHDYFTSCLPYPQKGPSVPIPIGSSAPVYGNSYGLFMTDGNSKGYFFNDSNVSGGNHAEISQETGSKFKAATPGSNMESTGNVLGVVAKSQSVQSGLYADLESATAATISSLREAFQLQRMFERDARGGSRYVEILKSHFRVTSPDFRLQRSEYLGGGSARVNINPVQQTSSSVEDSPQGNLAAYAQVAAQGGFVKSFTEHGIIIGLINMRGDITYQQGLERMWSRETRFDHYWPALAHLGEQEVYQKEIIYTDTPAEDEKIFGYNERYAEYRYIPSKITGMFRSTYSPSLDVWHLSEEFSPLGPPELNAYFIRSNLHMPLQRTVAVNSPYPEWKADVYHQVIAARPMPCYAVPGMIDHM